VLKKYFRYLFRYPESKFSGAVGSYQVHSIVEKSHKMLSKAPKIPNTKGRVVREKNINNAVANNSQSQVNKGKREFFLLHKNGIFYAKTKFR